MNDINLEIKEALEEYSQLPKTKKTIDNIITLINLKIKQKLLNTFFFFIPRKRLEYENKLKMENEKNNFKLIEEINELKNKLDEIKNKNKDYIKIIEVLQSDLNEEKNNINLANELNNEKNKIKNLILEKENEIEVLKNKIKKYPFELKEGEELISLIIISTDENILYSTICKNSVKFHKIENEFYKKYSQYSSPKNNFFIKVKGGKSINKLKSLKDNGINNRDVIILEHN